MLYPNWIRRVLLVLTFYFLNQAECVLNGEKVKDVNEFKYIVGIQIGYEAGGSLCGGSILGDYHILTAAHCLVNRTNDYEHPEKVKIRLHTLKNRDSMLQMKRYAQTLYFPTAYFQNNRNDGFFENDIAVIKVTKSMNLDGRNSRKLQRLELPESNHVTDGNHGVFAGYGVYDFERSGEAISDGRLRKLDVEVVGNHRCPTRQLILSKTLMCVRPDPVNTSVPQGNCYGDSGSPIVIKNRAGELKAVGVSSSVEDRREDCNNSNASGFFTKVHKFTNWIRDVMEGTYDATVTTVVDMHYTTSCFW